jgi:pimeloyl-ACP methyl ester carboxylesterase
MESVISVDGTPLAFDRTRSGPPLALVHGGTANHSRWEPIRPAVEEYISVYAMDRRGRGESGDTADYDLEREAKAATTTAPNLVTDEVLAFVRGLSRVKCGGG